MKNVKDIINNAKDLVDELVREEVKNAGQITLGELIERLKFCEFDKYISFCFGGLKPGKVNSYRGYYDHVAIEPDGEFRTVQEFLLHLESIYNTVMTGYKGGDYLMDADTPVWVAKYGKTSSTRVIGVEETEFDVKILTLEKE